METVHLGFGLVAVASMSILIERPLKGMWSRYKIGVKREAERGWSEDPIATILR